MSDEKKAKGPAPIVVFREKVREQKKSAQVILEGLKSTNAKVRSLAIKLAYATQAHDFIKKNVLPLIEADKSKKVLRTLARNVTRRELMKKVKKMRVPKKAHGKAAKPAADAAAPAEKAG